MLELFRYSDIQTTDLYLALYYLCSKEGLARAPWTSIPFVYFKTEVCNFNNYVVPFSPVSKRRRHVINFLLTPLYRLEAGYLLELKQL
jgi:hypothetical protein